MMLESLKESTNILKPDAVGSLEVINKNILVDLAHAISFMRSDVRYNAGIQLFFCGLLLNRFMDLNSKQIGINRNYIDIMYTLVTNGGKMKPTDLSRMLFRSKQNITGIIDSLEKNGLVERELSGKDRRTRKVLITEKGLDVVRVSLPAAQELIKHAIPSLSEREVRALVDMLTVVRKHLLTKLHDSK